MRHQGVVKFEFLINFSGFRQLMSFVSVVMSFIMKRFLVIFILFIHLTSLTISRKLSLCLFVREVTSQGVLSNDVFKHVCIASHISNFRTDFNGTNSFGIYAIQRSWLKSCNVTSVDELLDDNIDEDIRCAEKILQQSSVKAWSEEISCNHLRSTLDQCFDTT